MATIEALINVIEHTDDSWNAGRKLEQLVPDGKQLGTMLLEVLHRGIEPLVAIHEMHKVLFAHDVDFTAEDVVLFFKLMDRAFPNGVRKRGYSSMSAWSDDSPPGMTYYLPALFSVLSEKPNVLEELLVERSRIPEPYHHAVTLLLVANGKVPAEELPRSYLEECARVTLLQRSYSSSPHWMQKLPCSNAEWNALLVKVANSAPDFVIRTTYSLLPMREGPAEPLLNLFERVKFEDGADQLRVELLEFRTWAQEHFAELEAKVRSYGLALGTPEYGKPWPVWVSMLLYLRACKDKGVVPPTALDASYAKFFGAYRTSWSGGGDTERRDELISLAGCFPQDRLQAMLLKANPPAWNFYPACKTPEVCKEVVRLASQLPSTLVYQEQQLIPWSVQHMGEPLVPYILPLLDGKTSLGQDAVLRGVVLSARTPEAAKAQVRMLSSTVKSIRESAAYSLKHQPASFLMAELPALLSAKSKDVRLEAARLLDGLAPSEERAALASQFMAKEKSAPVKQLLEQCAAQTAPAKLESLEGFAPELVKELETVGSSAFYRFGDRAEELVRIQLVLLRNALVVRGDNRDHVIDETAGLIANAHRGLKNEQLEQAVREVLPALLWIGGTYNCKYLFQAARSYPALEAMIVEFLIGEEPAKWEKKGAVGFLTLLELAVEVFSEQPKQASQSLFVLALKDKRSGVRTNAMRALTTVASTSIETLLLPLLESEGFHTEDVAALLQRSGSTASIARLEAAAQKANTKNKVALSSALLCVGFASLVPENFPQNAEGDDALDKAIAALVVVDAPWMFASSALPKLHWKHSKKELSAATMRRFYQLSTVQSAEFYSPALVWLRERLLPEDRKAAWEPLDTLLKQPVAGAGAFLISTFGGDNEVLAFASRVNNAKHSQQTDWGTDGVLALRHNGSDTAIRSLDRLERTCKTAAVQRRAGSVLERMAKERSMLVDELLDEVLSDYGLGADGTLKLTVGSDTVLVRLTKEHKIVLEDAKGKVVKTAAAFKNATNKDALEAQVKAMEKEVPQALKGAVKRLEVAMSIGRSWSMDAWTKRFRVHGLFALIARGLVFEERDGNSVRRFVLDATRAPVDSDGRGLTLKEAATVRIAHPVYWSDDERARWSKHFAQEKCEQPFEQCARVVFKRAEGETVATVLAALRPQKHGYFVTAIRKLGYDPGPREDAGLVFRSSRTLGAWVFRLRHGGYSPDIDFEGQTTVESVGLSFGEKDVTDQELSAELWSELRRDLSLLEG